jgi:hypothetical protein
MLAVDVSVLGCCDCGPAWCHSPLGVVHSLASSSSLGGLESVGTCGGTIPGAEAPGAEAEVGCLVSWMLASGVRSSLTLRSQTFTVLCSSPFTWTGCRGPHEGTGQSSDPCRGQ